MAKTLQDFIITANLKLQVDITIKAESLEDAVQKSQTLIVPDFVNIKGEYNDGNIKIVGAYSPGGIDD
jgi:hypothetical protein